jgi:hypothetical protein
LRRVDNTDDSPRVMISHLFLCELWHRSGVETVEIQFWRSLGYLR